jgi:predicted TPR repeat methyltransferase
MGSELGRETDEATPAAAVDTDALMRQAMAFHRAGLLDKAALLYRQIVEHDPAHRDALHFFGVLSHQQGDDTAAVALISRAIAIDDSDPAFHGNLGIALKGCGRLDAAVAAYRRAIALAPEFPEAHNNLGIALYGLGKVEEAAAEYREALRHRPNYADAHFNLAVALRSAKALEDAVGAYQDALRCRPKHAEAMHGLAAALRELGRSDAAVAPYAHYIVERPDDVEAIKALGDLLISLKRGDEALAVYAAGLERRPNDPELLNNIGVALMGQGRMDEAAAVFAAALEHKPDFADAQYNAGVVFERSGRTEEAIAAFEETLKLRPAHPQAHHALGALYTVLGRRDDGARIYRHWQSVAPDHPVARHMAAAVDRTETPTRAADAYIRNLFAPFALTFDQVLAKLNYRVPELMAAVLARFPGSHLLDVADIGCGTGLCAAFLRPLARRLVGVDLSPEMLDKARDRQLYDLLVEAELTAFLNDNPAAFDLVVIADTLVYFGDLAPAFAAVGGALRSGGRVMFNLERDAAPPADGYRLNEYGRFVHGEDHVRRRIAEAGFTVLALDVAAIREQAKEAVPGFVVLAAK